MAKKHLRTSDNKSACGAVVDPKRLVDNADQATCNGCRNTVGLKQIKNPESDTRPDWSRKCEVCGQSPVVPITGMCGPCTFGEADTVAGNW